MSSLKYWVWLSAARGLGAVKSQMLLDFFGSPENVYYADENELLKAGLKSRDLAELSKKSFDPAERVMEDCDKGRIRIITYSDSEYPVRLRNIYSAPLILYIKGKMPDFDDEIAIAVVGSRKNTAYGSVVANKLSHELAMSGAYIVSGMAKGIDTAANRGALSAKRPTAAVLGCGADICYPFENKKLKEEIEETGVIITEYSPKTPPDAMNFPARNRIISGLSLGTLIVEAPKKSGALITAEYALEQGRDVFAVPGNIDNPSNEGSNELIKQGAKLITGAWDIIEEYAPIYPHKIIKNTSKAPLIPAYSGKAINAREEEAAAAQDLPRYEKGEKLRLSGLNPDEALIAGIMSDGKKHVDELIEKSEMQASKVLTLLTMMEMKKIIRQLPGKYFELA